MKQYSVTVTARELGMSPVTLRAWESRYQAVTPGRTETKRRFYSEAQLERLRLLLSLVNAGHRIGSIASLSDQKLRALVASEPKREISLSQLLKSLNDFDLAGVSEQLEELRFSSSTRDYVLKNVSPLLGIVGQKVSQGELSIAQEHALSAIIRDQLGPSLQLLHRREVRNARENSLLLTTAEGDLHEFGILLAAVLSAIHGFRAHYLGPNLPIEALVFAVQALKPKVIVLGNSPNKNERRFFENYLRDLGKKVPPSIEVWIGGTGHVPHLRSVFGKRNYTVLHSLDEFDKKLAKF